MALNLEEARAEQEKIKGKEDADGDGVVHQLDSSKIVRPRALTKAPSFFSKMFSSRKMNAVHADDEDIDFEGGDENDGNNLNEAGDLSGISRSDTEDRTNDDDEDSNEGQEEKEEDGNKEENDGFVDPPMPKIGKPVNIQRMVNRNRTAEFGLQKLMEMVMQDVDDSLSKSKRVPVADGFDRITVSEEQSKQIKSVRTGAAIAKEVTGNINAIQKALNYRKSALIMMNTNYSNQLVRQIEPIYATEARTITLRDGDEGAPPVAHRETIAGAAVAGTVAKPEAATMAAAGK
mmetsp:Transcript_12667/g.21200  ORF Transcript_12667/g.21200 Transcript_12667/m.21200 type:complete len:290 (-) Transcript_12667:49-918(-)